MVTTRICTRCKEEKSLDDFGKKKNGKYGKNSICKKCDSARTLEWQHNHKEMTKAIFNRWKLSNMEWYLRLKSTLKCSVCGESNIATLDFHHREPGSKDFGIGETFSKASKKRLIEEIEKCDVLCANCHRKLHFKEKHRGVDAENC